MKKAFLTLIFAVMTGVCAVAAKPTVYLLDFKNSADVQDGYIATVRGAVLEGFDKSGRTSLVDAVAEKSRYEEEMRRLKDNLASDDLEGTEALVTRGSNILVEGDVTALSFSTCDHKNSDGQTYHSYDATITLTLKVINALDGEILGSKTYNLPKSVLGFSGTSLTHVNYSKEEAVQAIRGDITKATRGFVDANFPLVGAVEDVESYSKNKKEVETMYVGLGSDNGIRNKTKLVVKVKNKIGKKIALKSIGEAEVIEVSGDEISLVKVKKGGEEVKKALDAGLEVVVTTAK